VVAEARRQAAAARYPVAVVVEHQVVDHSTANKNILVERHLEHSPAVTPRASTPSPCRTSVV
jgi:hypothetical protein